MSDDAVKAFLALLPKHAAELSITHNGHKAVYETVAQHMEDREDAWASADERQLAEASGDLWEVRWYPDTPVGFYCVAASTLEACLRHIAETKWD